jgi:hypothetical protein
MSTANATPATVRRTLTGHFDAEQISTVITLLSAAGIVATEVDKLHAAHVGHSNALEAEARRTAHRLGLPISAAGEISQADLARCLAGLSIETRLRHKTMFAAAGMLS